MPYSREDRYFTLNSRPRSGRPIQRFDCVEYVQWLIETESADTLFSLCREFVIRNNVSCRDAEKLSGSNRQGWD